MGQTELQRVPYEMHRQQTDVAVKPGEATRLRDPSVREDSCVEADGMNWMA